MLFNLSTSVQSIISASSRAVRAQSEQESFSEPNLFPQEVSGETLTDIHASEICLHLLDRLHYPEGKTFHFEFFDKPVLITAQW